MLTHCKSLRFLGENARCTVTFANFETPYSPEFLELIFFVTADNQGFRTLSTHFHAMGW